MYMFWELSKGDNAVADITVQVYVFIKSKGINTIPDFNVPVRVVKMIKGVNAISGNNVLVRLTVHVNEHCMKLTSSKFEMEKTFLHLPFTNQPSMFGFALTLFFGWWKELIEQNNKKYSGFAP